MTNHDKVEEMIENPRMGARREQRRRNCDDMEGYWDFRRKLPLYVSNDDIHAIIRLLFTHISI